TCGTAATRTAATPTRATAAGSSASTKAPALFPAFAHPLVEFVCGHAEHTDTRGAAGKRYRFRGDVRRNAGHRHSGRNNLVSSAARVCAGQPLNYGQTLESSPRSGRCRPLLGADGLLRAREQGQFKVGMS